MPQERLLDVAAKYLPNERLIHLIGRLVRTSSGRGIRQGGSLSPLLLNVYLDHLLDKKWRKQHPEVPLLRVADDLLLLCRTVDEARAKREELGHKLQAAGLPLKGTRDTAVRDLAHGHDARWLGFRLTKAGKDLAPHIGEKVWTSLARKLEATHRKADAPHRAVDTIRGWVHQQGPCFPYTDQPTAYARITDLARTSGFEEIPTQEEIQRDWERAFGHYQEIRRATGEAA